LVQKYCSIVLFIAISFQNIANTLTNLIAISFQIIANIHTTLFIGIASNLLPKQSFIIVISFQIIANIPKILSIEKIESNLLPKQLFVTKGFNHFSPLLTIKRKTNWCDNYHLFEPHSPNKKWLLSLEASIGSFYLNFLLCL
jgi:hypothetical protein